MAEWLTDTADILRNAGVPVIEEEYRRGPYDGLTWKQVGRDRGTGREGFTDFQFIMWHHDASRPGASPGVAEYCMYMALSPACNAWVCLGCGGRHKVGTWHLIAAGRANHAGVGGPGWGVAKDAMNFYAFGIEVDHTTGESWKPDNKQQQLFMLRKGTAALLQAYGLKPIPGLLFHKTWTDGGIDGVPVLPTRGRKVDIAGLDLLKERAQVMALMPAEPPTPEVPVGKPVVRVRDVQPGRSNASVRVVKKALAAEGFGTVFQMSPKFGRGMERAWKAWEKKLGYGPRANSLPSKESLTELGKRHGFEVM